MAGKALILNIKEKQVFFIKIRYSHRHLPQFDKKLQLLRLIKAGNIITKRALAERLKVNHNTIQKWRNLYKEGGIEMLLGIQNKTDLNAPIIRTSIYSELNKTRKGTMRFKDFYEKIKRLYLPDLKYNSFHKYISRNFSQYLYKFKKQ